ncbi:hypothetical protein DKY64_13305 [Stenotrophomonas maltophilia]|nr:hypothetical protein DKY64_13305 [Stenotrophomonas maltophilia]
MLICQELFLCLSAGFEDVWRDLAIRVVNGPLWLHCNAAFVEYQEQLSFCFQISSFCSIAKGRIQVLHGNIW